MKKDVELPKEESVSSNDLLALVEDMETSADYLRSQVERMSDKPNMKRFVDRWAERAGTEQFWANVIRDKILGANKEIPS